jgi:hypothetical protein
MQPKHACDSHEASPLNMVAFSRTQYSPGKGQRRWLTLLGAATWPDVLRRFLGARIALNATFVGDAVKGAAGAAGSCSNPTPILS